VRGRPIEPPLQGLRGRVGRPGAEKDDAGVVTHAPAPQPRRM
jgi:hypothetical protein